MAIRKSKEVLFAISRQRNITPFSSSCETEDHQDQIIISTAVSILREQRSRSRWNFLKSVCHNGFTPNQASKIIINLKNNAHLAYRFFLWSDKNGLCNHDLHSYSTMIHILARSRLKTHSQTLIRNAIRMSENQGEGILDKPLTIFEILVKTYRSCDSSPFVFDILVRACLELKKLDRAAEIVRLLKSRQIYLTIQTYNSLIQSICQTRGSEEGLQLYREMFGEETGDRIRVPPNLRTFNSLLLSLHRDQKLEQAEEILNQMLRFNCDPNVFTYSVLMAGFSDVGNVIEALRLWNEMLEKEIKPDIIAYNTLIGGLCGSEEVEEAEVFYRRMIMDEIEPTCLTYEHLIKGHCRVGAADSALLLYKDMSRHGFKPEVSTVNEVIRELCRNSMISEAIGFFREVMERGNCFPNRASYDYLIDGFCREGKMEEALKLQAEMVDKGFEPDSNTYSSFIDGYNKQGEFDKARKVENQMIGGTLFIENNQLTVS